MSCLDRPPASEPSERILELVKLAQRATGCGQPWPTFLPLTCVFDINCSLSATLIRITSPAPGTLALSLQPCRNAPLRSRRNAQNFSRVGLTRTTSNFSGRQPDSGQGRCAAPFPVTECRARRRNEPGESSLRRSLSRVGFGRIRSEHPGFSEPTARTHPTPGHLPFLLFVCIAPDFTPVWEKVSLPSNENAILFRKV